MRNIKVLFTEADRARLQPLFEELRAKGLRVQEAGDALKTSEAVLAVLSENAYADKKLIDRVLGLIGAGAEALLPLQLDGAPIPEAVMHALYARNIIFAAERDDKLIAERIVDALPKKKNRLPLILSVAAAVFIAAAGLLIWRAVQSRAAFSGLSEDAISVLVSAGLTEEDLAAVEDVVIVGDKFAYMTHDEFIQGGSEHWLSVDDDVAYRAGDRFAYLTRGEADEDESVIHYNVHITYSTDDADDQHWISIEDGHSYELTRYEDLSFLSLMPNLRYLELVSVEADANKLPDLSQTEALQSVGVYDCAIDSLDWLSGAQVQELVAICTPIADYSPLNTCERLSSVQLDLRGMPETGVTGFAPPALECFEIEIDNERTSYSMDLSALAGCDRLKAVGLVGLPIRDISFLANKTGLESLMMFNLPQLRDVSALGTLTGLADLNISFCPGLTDYTPIAGCAALESLTLNGDDPDTLHDASFLADLPKLNDIQLSGFRLRGLDFLEGLAQHRDTISLHIAGPIADYSGLAAFRNYKSLLVNPIQTDDGYGAFYAVLPYIKDAEIEQLSLCYCDGVDLAELPKVTYSLYLSNADLRDLSGLQDYGISQLSLWDCKSLSSLNGIEALPGLKDGSLGLTIKDCPRMADYSALDGAALQGLRLSGVYALPDLGAFTVKGLELEHIVGLSDLNCLDAMSSDEQYSGFQFIGLDQLSDISALRRLHGNWLAVPPQVADQAAELVESGNFKRYEVVYPDDSWQPSEVQLELTSLDELNTLPKALLAKVESLTVAGDRVVDWERCSVFFENRANGKLAAMLWDEETGRESAIPRGSIEDMSVFADLTGLKTLSLYNQPLSSLDGIQDLTELEHFEAVECSRLTDVSALFALQNLRTVSLQGCPVTSIQGIQNLTQLEDLNLFYTQVSDLSPLALCDFTAATENGGFTLGVAELPCEDLSALGSIPCYAMLGARGLDARSVVEAVSASKVNWLDAAGLHLDDELFARFVAEHPTVAGLFIPRNEGVTDLTPLLSLEQLTSVTVSRNMKQAIASLKGQSYSFGLYGEG